MCCVAATRTSRPARVRRRPGQCSPGRRSRRRLSPGPSHVVPLHFSVSRAGVDPLGQRVDRPGRRRYPGRAAPRRGRRSPPRPAGASRIGRPPTRSQPCRRHRVARPGGIGGLQLRHQISRRRPRRRAWPALGAAPSGRPPRCRRPPAQVRMRIDEVFGVLGNSPAVDQQFLVAHLTRQGDPATTPTASRRSPESRRPPCSRWAPGRWPVPGTDRRAARHPLLGGPYSNTSRAQALGQGELLERVQFVAVQRAARLTATIPGRRCAGMHVEPLRALTGPSARLHR
jgi:hypothetical protein